MIEVQAKSCPVRLPPRAGGSAGPPSVCPRCSATCQQAAAAAQEDVRAQLEGVFSPGAAAKPFNKTLQQTGAPAGDPALLCLLITSLGDALCSPEQKDVSSVITPN